MAGSILDTPIEYLKGVGPKRGEMLRKELDVFTFGDLLQHYPFRYVDRSKFHKVREINAELPYVQIRGILKHIEELGAKRARRLVALFSDGTGTVELVWFKGIRWIKPTLKTGVEYVVFGKPTSFKGKINIPHPEIDAVTPATSKLQSSLQPVYPSGEKLTSRGLNSRGIEKLQRTLEGLVEGEIDETLSADMLTHLKLLPKTEAVKNIHFPTDAKMLQRAQLRLKYEELFFIQLGLLKMKLNREQKIKGFVFKKVGDHFNEFYKNKLPFELTNAQKRVIKEMRKDLGSGKQMNRLLQGDVGSGKTIVSLLLMLIALDNGYQACLMAPTEILAQQHADTIQGMLEETDITVGLLTGSSKTAQRKQLDKVLSGGDLNILIGTHALLEDWVQFKSLGLVIIDEQHRFGVAQRARLWDKSPPLPVRQAGPTPPQGRGADTPGYETARASSYALIKELQEERKRQTTEAEQILWEYLKGKQLERYKFRRQHIIDEFIVDFVCLTKRLIIEIDGRYHEKREVIEADKLRTQLLNNLGYKVIRFKNEAVIGDIEAVLKKIKDELNSLPLGEGRGGASFPHILVMTATPIPRTLAMTFYGDLDVSVIDEMPPGRKPVKTSHRYDSSRLRVFGFMREQIAKGRQVYVVYPLIQESEKMDYKDLVDGYESITRAFPLPEYKVSVLHGKMKTADKDFEMQRFVKGQTNILVSTTVIEVGVDVSNASVMVIESAERFGLSQLHQLRGRVGRGADQSYCILMTDVKLTSEGKLRMETMTRTSDGFEVAEVDLKLRGPGDLTGTQQSGILALKIADLARDGQILQHARDTVLKLLKDDPTLEKPVNQRIANQYRALQKDRQEWGRIS